MRGRSETERVTEHHSPRRSQEKPPSERVLDTDEPHDERVDEGIISLGDLSLVDAKNISKDAIRSGISASARSCDERLVR
jgi:hypothetical protein